jgi:hypothetical protein
MLLQSADAQHNQMQQHIAVYNSSGGQYIHIMVYQLCSTAYHYRIEIYTARSMHATHCTTIRAICRLSCFLLGLMHPFCQYIHRARLIYVITLHLR